MGASGWQVCLKRLFYYSYHDFCKGFPWTSSSITYSTRDQRDTTSIAVLALRVIQEERKFIDTSNVLFWLQQRDTLTFKSTLDLFDNPITYVPFGKRTLPPYTCEPVLKYAQCLIRRNLCLIFQNWILYRFGAIFGIFGPKWVIRGELKYPSIQKTRFEGQNCIAKNPARNDTWDKFYLQQTLCIDKGLILF